jgi:hypothetical protein
MFRLPHSNFLDIKLTNIPASQQQESQSKIPLPNQKLSQITNDMDDWKAVRDIRDAFPGQSERIALELTHTFLFPTEKTNAATKAAKNTNGFDIGIICLRHLYAQVDPLYHGCAAGDGSEAQASFRQEMDTMDEQFPLLRFLWLDFANNDPEAVGRLRFEILKTVAGSDDLRAISKLSYEKLVEHPQMHSLFWTREPFMLYHEVLFYLDGDVWSKVDKAPETEVDFAQSGLIEFSRSDALSDAISERFGLFADGDRKYLLMLGGPAVIRAKYAVGEQQDDEAYEKLRTVEVTSPCIDETDDAEEPWSIRYDGRKRRFTLIAAVRLRSGDQDVDLIRLWTVRGVRIAPNQRVEDSFGESWSIGERNRTFMLYYVDSESLAPRHGQGAPPPVYKKLRNHLKSRRMVAVGKSAQPRASGQAQPADRTPGPSSDVRAGRPVKDDRADLSPVHHHRLALMEGRRP